MDGRTAARFPFLKDSAAYAMQNGPGLYDVLSSPVCSDIRERGMDRVMGAVMKHTIPDVPLVGRDADQLCIDEMLSYPYARIIVSCVDDKFLTKRYALAEAERMNMLLGVDKSALPAVIQDLDVKAVREKDGAISMHFSDFLRYSYVMRATEWKLINMDVRNGYVRLDEQKFVRLLQNALSTRIESEIPLDVPDDIRALVQDQVGIVQAEIAEMKRKMSPTGGQGVKNEYLPPCIKNIISMAQAGQNLSHSARFALVSYLHALGMDYEQIVGVFAVSPDFDESISEYQIKHITGELSGGEGYTPPECGTMKTNGNCCCGDDPLCEKINHPLNYYRIKSGSRKPIAPSDLNRGSSRSSRRAVSRWRCRPGRSRASLSPSCWWNIRRCLGYRIRT